MDNQASTELFLLEKAKQAAKRQCFPGLLPILAAQQRLPLTTAQQSNLLQLDNSSAAAVISGQQIGLFLGPLYAVYKAVAAISYARLLTARGAPCVPIFWLQTEDHDFDEIRQATFQTRESELCLLELPPRDEQRVSVQEARVSTEINELLSRIQAELGHHQHTAWVLGLLEKHYLPGARLSEAFSGFLAEMTAPHGLLIFNPRDELSRGIGKGVFSWAYEQRQKIHDRLLDSAARLASQGIKPQVALRSDSPLFFFHPQGADGPRVRLSENGDSWSMIGADGSVSDEHLRAALVENPGQFSTSALLRPILQDALFPTAAYLGGPAERRYFEQLLPVYSLRPYPAPCILPRPSLLLLDEKVRRYLTSLNLPLSSLMASEDEAQAQLAKSLVGNFPIPDEMEKSSRQTASAAFAPYREVFSKLDRSLLKPLEKAEQKTLSSLSSFKERYIRILLDHNSQQAERLIKVRNLIRPRGEPQERQLCALYYLCRYGQGFIEHLLEKVKLFCEEEQRIEL